MRVIWVSGVLRVAQDVSM